MTAITIVTHAAMPAGAPDDVILAAALRERGASVRFAVWDDADVDWSAAPITVIRSTWDYHFKPNAWFDWLDRVAAVTRVTNPAPLVRWNSDKSYLLDLKRAGVPTIPTVLLDDKANVGAVSRARGWDDVVIKPTIGASSNDVLRFRGVGIASHGAEHARSLMARGRALLQPYQSAIETERERSLVYVDGVFSHAFSKPGFHAGLGGEALRMHVPSQTERRLADDVFAALPEPARIARIDILPAESGPLLMEAELIEPQLALHLHADAPGVLASALLSSGQVRPPGLPRSSKRADRRVPRKGA